VINIKSVKIITLGCKTNFYESAAMANLLSEKGYDITEDDIADIYIINSCTVTNSGAARSRSAIRRCKRKNPASIVAVTGCLAQMQADEVAEIDGVDIVAGVERGNIVELIEGAKIKKRELPTEFEELSAIDTQSRVRAVIKIQDGCDHFCSYCIIPYARGRARSRKLENIIAEAMEIARRGYLEVVITGINLTSYGKDLPEDIGLIDVVERLNEIDGIERIRLGSLSPTIVNDDFAARAALADKLCPQFHLSLQSGSDEVLRVMNRKYDTEQYYQAVRLLRKNIPNTAITTDLIVGFPGESAAQFEESYEFCKRVGFSQMHIFKYSKRAGTAAADMDGQISKVEKERRSSKMLELALHMKSEFYAKYVGEVMEVLFESCKKSVWSGLTANYMDVLVKSADDLEGKIKKVKITGFDGENLVGEVID